MRCCKNKHPFWWSQYIKSKEWAPCCSYSYSLCFLYPSNPARKLPKKQNERELRFATFIHINSIHFLPSFLPPISSPFPAMTHFHNPNTPNHNSLHDPSAPPDKAWLRLSIAPTHLHHPQPLKINESLPHLPTPFQLHPALHSPTSNSDILRVIDPPRRPQSGIWFSLQPLELNQYENST